MFLQLIYFIFAIAQSVFKILIVEFLCHYADGIPSYLCKQIEYSAKMNFLSIFLGMVGPWQIVLIVVIVLLLFGGKKIPELMRGLGSGVREFKDAMKDPEKKDDTK